MAAADFAVMVQWFDGAAWRGGWIYGTSEFDGARNIARSYARGEYAKGMAPTRARIVAVGPEHAPAPEIFEQVFEVEQTISALASLNWMQFERDSLRSAAAHLLACLAEDHGLWLSLSLTVHDAIDRVSECGVPRPEEAKSDPIADAEEDHLYRSALARMEAAEAREDAAATAAAHGS